MEWHPFYYKGHETNIEVNKQGEVRRVPKDWLKKKHKKKYVSKRINSKYYKIDITIDYIGAKTLYLHQIIASVFLNYQIGFGNNYVVDHIDENKLNNKLQNLQILTNKENILKSINYKRKLGIKKNKTIRPYNIRIKDAKGWVKIGGLYYSTISFLSKRISLGYYKTPEEASAAYQEALRKINAGEFVTD